MTARRRRGLIGVAVVGALLVALVVWRPWSDGGASSRQAGRGAADGSGRGSDGTGAGGPAAGADDRPGVEGGVVRLGFAGALVVDPPYAAAASPEDQLLLDLLYDGLTRLGSGGTALPAVASSWTSDPAQRVWRFTLDPSVRFTSGRAITSSDVVASLQHVMAGGDGLPAAVRLESIEGYRAYVDGTSPTVSGLRAFDAATVEIALDAPLAQLPVLLAAPAYGIVDVPGLADLAAGGSPTRLPGSIAPGDAAPLDLTGSWAVGEVATDELRLTRRAGTPGHLDGVALRPYESADAAFSAFIDEQVDWAPVPGERYGEAVDAYGIDAFEPFAAVLYLGLRADGPALSSLPLRRAIAAALDRPAIVAAVYPDEAGPLVGITPDALGPASDQAPTFDLDRARQLVREAFPSGQVPTIGLDHDASPASAALMELVGQSLGEVGIPTADQPRSLDAYQRLLVTGQQQLFALSWLGGWSSPGAYLDPLLRSSSPENLLGLRDPALDAALDAARATGDPAVAAQHWRDVEGSALSSALLIPIAQFRTQVVVADRVLRLRPALDGTVDWASVQLAA